MQLGRDLTDGDKTPRAGAERVAPERGKEAVGGRGELREDSVPLIALLSIARPGDAPRHPHCRGGAGSLAPRF